MIVHIDAETDLMDEDIKWSTGQDSMFYVCTDRQGSVTALINQTGTVSERYSYDAYGRRRNPANWNDYNVPAPSLINRGYTGHEMLDGFGLINMNGRMYDPVIGRILSPDPFVSSATSTQSYNRYSYCLNNPLRYTDPSGYSVAPIYNWSYQDLSEPGSGGGASCIVGDVGATLCGSYGGYTYNKNTGEYMLGGNVVPFWEIQQNYVAPNTSERIILLFAGPPNDPYQIYTGYRVEENSSESLYKKATPSLQVHNEPGGVWDVMGVGSVPYHGIAWFGTNFVGPGPDGPNANPYNLKDNHGKTIKPIDAIDAAAQRHDYSYWKSGASGVEGAIFNKTVTSADIHLVADAYSIMQGFSAGAIDPRTSLPISERTNNIASGIYNLFSFLVYNKLVH
jgi:RHS repeat-associated protein